MYLENVGKLASHLASPSRDLGEICKYLVLETFADLNPRSIYLAEVIDEGRITHIASFGFEREAVSKWGAFPLTVALPITDAVKKSACVILDSQEESFKKYPLLKDIPDYDGEWKSFISCPMQQYGAYSLVLNEPAPKDEEFEYFLKTIGTLIALHQIREGLRTNRSFAKSREHTIKQGLELTPRQEQIRSLMEKGMTNPAIAAEIGYSESLVRHETIEIYAKLNISGRKELLENSGGGGASLVRE